LYSSKGEYDRALQLFEECLEKRKRILGEDHPDTLKSLNDLADFFESQGQYDRALQLSEECLAKRSCIFGSDHPDTKDALITHSSCAKKRDHSIRVESAMQLIDVSLVPVQMLGSAKQRVRDRLGLVLPK
jgi:tetratricopeptide (TPR) repeat protein